MKFNWPNIFWGGFIVYMIGFSLSYTTQGGSNLYAIIQVMGLFLMIPSMMAIVKFKFDNTYLKLIYILYCSWIIYLLVSGFSYFTDYTFVRGFFLNPRVGLLYFAPLLLLFPRDFYTYKKVFEVIFLFGVLFLVFDVLFIRDLLNSDNSSATAQTIIETFSYLSFPSGFILLTYFYHSKKKQALALIVIVGTILLTVIRARRGLLFMYLSMSFFSFFIYLFRSKTKFLILYLTLLAGLIAALVVEGVYRPTNSRLFGHLIERGDQNTREVVELYFHDDMKTMDWIFGRGINGEYFAPDIEKDMPTNYRGTIETGYEQTILKGGLISLGLFLLIAIPGMLKGIFFSKNVLSKASGLWIFMALVNSYPATINAFTPQYLLVWMCIGICYSREIRNIPEERMMQIFVADKNQ